MARKKMYAKKHMKMKHEGSDRAAMKRMKRKKGKSGGYKSREDFIKDGEDALGDMPL